MVFVGGFVGLRLGPIGIGWHFVMEVVDMIICVVMRVHIRQGGVGGWVFVPCVFWVWWRRARIGLDEFGWGRQVLAMGGVASVWPVA